MPSTYLKFDKDEAFHRAKSDAYYTALILEGLPRAVLKNYSIDYYRTPKNRKEEVYVVFDTYSKYISREFATKERAMKDREVLSTRCYLCGNPAKKKLRWFSGGSRLYYSVSCCEEHGYLKGKIRLKKAENGKVFAVKTLKLVSSEEAEGIRERKSISKKNAKRKLCRSKRACKAFSCAIGSCFECDLAQAANRSQIINWKKDLLPCMCHHPGLPWCRSPGRILRRFAPASALFCGAVFPVLFFAWMTGACDENAKDHQNHQHDKDDFQGAPRDGLSGLFLV